MTNRSVKVTKTICVSRSTRTVTNGVYTNTTRPPRGCRSTWNAALGRDPDPDRLVTYTAILGGNASRGVATANAAILGRGTNCRATRLAKLGAHLRNHASTQNTAGLVG